MRTGRTVRYIKALLVVLACTFAAAQIDSGAPQMPDEWLDRTNRMLGDKISVCINTESVMAPFELDLWNAIADALLVELKVTEIRGLGARPILDYTLSLSETELYQVLFNVCQALGGFLFSNSQFPNWMTITRPYVLMGFVAATTSPTAATLGDFTSEDRVGTKMGSSADLAFVDQAGSRQGQRRFRRVPYPNNQLLIDRLQEGELEAVIIWEPGLATWSAANPDSSIRVIPSDPVRLPVQQFGVVMLQREAFLRAALDEAIVALIEDGTIDRLLAENGLPGRAPR